MLNYGDYGKMRGMWSWMLFDFCW